MVYCRRLVRPTCEYIFSGDYPSKSQAEYDYIKISDLFTRGGGFIPKDKDNANTKITFTISPIGDGNYQIIGNNGGDSKFSRYVNIVKSTSNPDEALVKVRVSWTNSQGDQKIDLQNFIYNYSENI